MNNIPILFDLLFLLHKYTDAAGLSASHSARNPKHITHKERRNTFLFPAI